MIIKTNKKNDSRFTVHGSRGFTLIEVMVVVVILGILAAIIVPRIMGRPEEAKRTKAAVDIKGVEQALNLYKLDNGMYPNTEQGLEALVNKPETAPVPNKWKEGGYLSKVPLDPWGRPYQYLSPGDHGDFDLYSHGADGEPGGEGKDADVESWNL
ncbi:MAG: type II secretion system major pseudopilin GspG [Deltaproteobacteria bacterium]